MLTEHEIELRVRYRECDPMGLLHHSQYLTYFEIARTELYRASGGDYRKMEEEGRFVVVVRVECRYHRPARYDDVLRVQARIVRVTAAKIEHEYRVTRGAELLTVGHATLAIVDRRGAVQPVPEEMRTGDWSAERDLPSQGESGEPRM